MGEETLESLKLLTCRGAMLVCNLAATEYSSFQFGSIPAVRPQFTNHVRMDMSFLLEGQYHVRLLKVRKPVPPL